MPGFGIDTVEFDNGQVLRIRKSQWTKNVTLNYWYEAKNLINEYETTKQFLIRINKQYKLTLANITKFISNSNLIKVSQLYPGKESAVAVFAIIKGNLSLLTIGSKTLQEYRLTGHDSYRKSRVPFLINEELESINLYL